jgi:hypothetical protein
MTTNWQPSRQEILRRLQAGELNINEAQQALYDLFKLEGNSNPAQATMDYLQVSGFNPAAGTSAMRSGGGVNPLPAQGTGAAFETQTDPFTAYLNRLGIGGKMAYNPAQQYQVGLYDPLKSIYDVQQRLHGAGAVLQDPNKMPATFSDYMSKTGAGVGGLVESARGQLQNIFGATPEQKASIGSNVGMNYEPSQYDTGTTGEGQAMNAGSIDELANLIRYGLRGTQGIMGSRYAASRLPQAQQAYYSQKSAGSTTQPNFIDWLKSNWGI